MTYLALIIVPVILVVGAVMGPSTRTALKDSLVHGQEQLRVQTVQTVTRLYHQSGLAEGTSGLVRRLTAVILRWSAERLEEQVK